MTSATIAVKGSASADFAADFAIVHFGCEYKARARSEALAGGNAVIAQLRDIVEQLGTHVREIKVQSLRVQESFNHVGPDRIQEHFGWVAQLGGQLLMDPSIVPVAYARLIQMGVRIHQLTWHLDPDTELQAHRAVRRLAVADAREAANDFALALGANLGDLITLADPGLLGVTNFANTSRTSSHTGFATAGASNSRDEYVEIDPELITITANVEASYEVTLS
jgi:uncharacterized protein